MKLDRNNLTYMISEAIESVYNNEKGENFDGVADEQREEGKNNFNEQPTNNMVGENRTMRKQVYRLTESDLHKIIKDTVMSMISEKSDIHIKKKNRGKFTALKQKTGHSTSWFLKNGTKHEKQMAQFDKNSKEWNKK